MNVRSGKHWKTWLLSSAATVLVAAPGSLHAQWGADGDSTAQPANSKPFSAAATSPWWGRMAPGAATAPKRTNRTGTPMYGYPPSYYQSAPRNAYPYGYSTPKKAAAPAAPAAPPALPPAPAPELPRLPTVAETEAAAPMPTTTAQPYQSEVEGQLELMSAQNSRQMPSASLAATPHGRTPLANGRNPMPTARTMSQGAMPNGSVPVRPPQERGITGFFKRLMGGRGTRSAPHAHPSQVPHTISTTTPDQQDHSQYGQPSALPQPESFAMPAPAATRPLTRTPVASVPQKTSVPSTFASKPIPAPPAELPMLEGSKPTTDLALEPFPEGSETDADDKEQTSPFGGLTLDESASLPPITKPAPVSDSPAPLPTIEETNSQPLPQNPVTLREPVSLEAAGTQPKSEPKKEEQPAKIAATSLGSAPTKSKDDPNADKFRRIASRAELKGLKGFCPVTLRDDRGLADGQEQFTSTFHGQTFHFASADAKARFDADPELYVPAADGNDVVMLAAAKVAEGSLDHAVWYKGRLYLFSSQASLQAFKSAPSHYALPEVAR